MLGVQVCINLYGYNKFGNQMIMACLYTFQNIKSRKQIMKNKVTDNNENNNENKMNEDIIRKIN